MPQGSSAVRPTNGLYLFLSQLYLKVQPLFEPTIGAEYGKNKSKGISADKNGLLKDIIPTLLTLCGRHHRQAVRTLKYRCVSC